MLKLPLSRPVTNALLTLLNAHNTFMRGQKEAHLQLLVHMMEEHIRVLGGKLAKRSGWEYRGNALKVMRFYLMGYRMQARYFTQMVDKYVEIIVQIQDDLS